MSALQAMAIAIVVSVCVSTVLVAGLMTQRVLSSALFGAFAALSGIGLRMSTLRTSPRA